MEHVPLNGLVGVRGWNFDPTIGLAVVIVYAAALTFLLVRARMRYLALPNLQLLPEPGPMPDCMVVIPARNEERVISRAVRSLPPDSVIVVDDGSSDRTAVEAEDAGAGVLRSPKLRQGVLGKPHACMFGAKALEAKWILFVDADTWYEKGWIETIVAAAEANGLSFVSVHLKQEPSTFAAHVLLPYTQALFFTGIDPVKKVDGAFRGQCMLVRREAYEFVGGHAASLSFPVDDMKLATLAIRHRMKIGVARTKLGHAEDREGWVGMWHQIARMSQRFSLLPGNNIAALSLTILLGAFWVPMIAVGYAAGWPLAAAGVGVLLPLLLLPWYRNAFRALLAPLALYAMLPMAVHALYCILTIKKVRWKGREV
jgi:chlorobactene glucosyltransferase